jgi:hypothetical protein
MADESDVVAHSVDEATGARTDYTSISDAVNAGYAGQIIVSWTPEEIKAMVADVHDSDRFWR